MKTIMKISAMFLLATLLMQGGALNAKAPDSRGVPITRDSGLSLSPSPITMDQITHNNGNIVTTVDNHGYIGGYQGSGRPSGEWPRNSGHDYIGELMYWMGATLPNGDTLVANTWEEFQGMPSLISGVNDNKILLSTDTTRYWGYDTSDTVGMGHGNPAHGWREWCADSGNYIYVQNYDPIADEFYPGGPVALQESHYRFNDAADGSPLLGLEITHTILQWNYCYNEDFLFVILEITNASEIDYADFAIGLYIDIDVGGFDGTGENGRLEDLVDYDISENLAWTYDSKGIDPGWGPTVRTGVMGTKYLETPDDIGMTALRTGAWSLVPNNDPDRFALINEQQFDTPLPPEDQYYIQCTRGIDLTAGKTVRVVYALIAGEDEEAFRANAALAQQLYDNNFVGPQPPPTPLLSARAGDGKVYLSWTDTSEVGLDPLSGENDFVGYKLYRSDNQGKTWGTELRDLDNNCLSVDYDPLALYAINAPGDPIQHSFIDTGLYNGVEYWYCLAAFDRRDTVTGIDPLQSGFGIAGASQNIVAAMPRTDPAGFYDAAATTEHEFTGYGLPSDGDVIPIIFDASALTGNEYSVVFEDTPGDTYWHLVNNTTGDTLLANQTLTDVDPGLFNVAEGLRVVVKNGDREPRSVGQTGFAGADTTLVVADNYGPAVAALTGDTMDVFTDAAYRSTFELRYTGQSTTAPEVREYWYGALPPYDVPFEVWNTTTEQRVSLAVYDLAGDGVWDSYDLLAVVDYPYEAGQDLTSLAFPFYYGWLIALDDEVYDPAINDVLTIEGAPLNGPDDAFTFKVDGVNAAAASTDLDDIRVVPDPYFVQYSAMVETLDGQSVLEFQNVPDRCTIRIYTLSGDLVETLEHTDGTGTARWDLLSKDQQQIASGIYIFHVESPYGERLGRFAVVK